VVFVLYARFCIISGFLSIYVVYIFHIFSVYIWFIWLINYYVTQSPSIKKKLRFYYLFILVRTTTKSIQFINKPVFLISFFPCCCFAFISKQQHQKNRHFIYDLSMLWLGLDLTHEISYTVCIDSMCNTNLHIMFLYFHYVCSCVSIKILTRAT
jgi:hypothetical protein